MKTKITLSILLALLYSSSALSGENRFRLGFQMGPFVPQDWQVQGYAYIYYQPDGNPSSGRAVGFGNGFDLLMFADYIAGDWSIRLEWGARIMQNRKLKYYTLPDYGRTYENKMTVVPVTLSLLRFAGNSAGRFSPYFGFGGGIYFTNWEEFETRTYGSGLLRTWYKGSESPIGAHFLAGLGYRIWKGASLSLETRYSYVHSDWVLKEEDSQQISKRADINIGGISIRLGVSYEF